MKETEQILLKMGFINTVSDIWKSDWFGTFILLSNATPEDLAKFIYYKGVKNVRKETAPDFKTFNVIW